MIKYGVPFGTLALVAATAKTVVTVITGATRRARAYKFEFSADSTTNTDKPIKWDVMRFTTDGTGTAVTPVAVDPGEPAAICTAKQNYTVEPTGSPTVLNTNSLTPQPGGTCIVPFEQGGEPVATVSALLALRLTSPQAQGNVYGTLWFWE